MVKYPGYSGLRPLRAPVKSFNQVTEMGVVGSRKKVTEHARLFLLVVL
jgi:hypothetical protein